MLRAVCLLATCLLDRAWSSGSHNEDYEECREHEYPCFVQTGHSALHAQKYEEAVEWFKKAADEGYAPGLDAMGFLYQMGQGVPLDREKAFEYYEKAAEAGDEQGLFHLGACYSAGIGIKKDQRKAVHYWGKAAESGHASAAFNLGVRFEQGNTVPQDKRRALGLFEKAASKGHLGAMYNLGVFLTHTTGPRQNETQGCQWFENITLLGDTGQARSDPIVPRAMTNLALCYLTGVGMPHDLEEGKMFLELAAKGKGQGAGRAQSLLDRGLGKFATPVVPKKNYKDYKMGGNGGQEL
jgi:hypothetical protein